MFAVMMIFLFGFLCDKVVVDFFSLQGQRDVWGILWCHVVFPKKRAYVGPISVDLMLRRRWSMDVPDALDVEMAILMVSTCHSMKPFDLR